MLQFVLHVGAVAAQADSWFLDSAVAGAPATLGMTKLGMRLRLSLHALASFSLINLP